MWTEFFKDNTLFGLLAALFGGAGVRILDKILSKRSETFNEAERIRGELRKTLESTQAEVIALRAQANEWQTKYWAEVEKRYNATHSSGSVSL